MPIRYESRDEDQPVQVVAGDGSGSTAELDGAIAELSVRPDGTVTAEVRIPGPEYGQV
jgi:hypothetical protein